PADDDSIDGKPISENGLAEELSLVSTLSATTDDDGKFAISNVDPEMTYRMVLRASGYVRQEYGQHTFPGIGRLINLKPGQDLKGINVTLTPTGSIEGTVRAVSGEPLQEVRIRLLRYTFNRDGTKLLQLT